MVSGATQVPGPPPGPGVRVPFAGPPTDRNRKRLWISLGVGGAALVLCCAGGVAALGGLVVATERALPVQARTVVRDYLDGLARGDFDKAYDQVCTARQSRQSLGQFSTEQRDLPHISGFSLRDAVAEGGQFEVPADVRIEDGSTEVERYTVISDRRAGEMRVCDGPR
jgi:hypothetical protein